MNNLQIVMDVILLALHVPVLVHHVHPAVPVYILLKI